MDFTQLILDIIDLRNKVSELLLLAQEAEQGYYTSLHLGQKTFTAAEKTSMVSQYNALKAEAVVLFQLLP